MTWSCLSLGFLAALSCQPAAQPPAQQPAQPPAQEKPAAKRDAKAEVEKLLAEQGITIDKAKGIVRARGKVTVTDDFIEYVAIGPQGKRHEGLVTLECLGSTLKAALMVIGVKEGKNVDFKPVVPMPSEEEVRKGAPTVTIVEPQGPRLHLALTWTDDKQREHTVSIDDLVVDLRAGAPLQNGEWIYFGGMMAPMLRNEPPVFVADYEQNYVSTYLTKPDSHLITLKHERARFDDNWFANTELLPPRGTSCVFVLSLQPIVDRLPAKKAGDAGQAPDPKKDIETKKE
jgi:hypothetical protein